MRRPRSSTRKIAWSGDLISVQPRIRLNRSFDPCTHESFGQILGVRGTIDAVARDLLVAVSKGAHDKHAFEDRAAGERVGGPCA